MPLPSLLPPPPPPLPTNETDLKLKLRYTMLDKRTLNDDERTKDGRTDGRTDGWDDADAEPTV